MDESSIHLYDPEAEWERILWEKEHACPHHSDKYRRDDSWLKETFGDDADLIEEGWVCRRCGNRAIRLKYDP